jgi:hypothetical protein
MGFRSPGSPGGGVRDGGQQERRIRGCTTAEGCTDGGTSQETGRSISFDEA